jgi:hypothetical protein
LVSNAVSAPGRPLASPISDAIGPVFFEERHRRHEVALRLRIFLDRDREFHPNRVFDLGKVLCSSLGRNTPCRSPGPDDAYVRCGHGGPSGRAREQILVCPPAPDICACSTTTSPRCPWDVGIADDSHLGLPPLISTV